MQIKEENYKRHKQVEDKLKSQPSKDNLEENLAKLEKEEQKDEILIKMAV